MVGIGGAELSNLPRGARIYTSEQTKDMLSDGGMLHSLNTGLGDSANTIKGIKHNQALINAISRNNPANAIIAGFNKTMGSRTENNISIDERGFNVYQSKLSSKRKYLNRKTSM
jgi:hypothetical protein